MSMSKHFKILPTTTVVECSAVDCTPTAKSDIWKPRTIRMAPNLKLMTIGSQHGEGLWFGVGGLCSRLINIVSFNWSVHRSFSLILIFQWGFGFSRFLLCWPFSDRVIHQLSNSKEIKTRDAEAEGVLCRFCFHASASIKISLILWHYMFVTPFIDYKMIADRHKTK